MSDSIDRQQAIDKMVMLPKYFDKTGTLCLDYADVLAVLSEHLPSAQPTYTDVEIQKMQELESAQIEKAYQLGYEDGKKDTQQDFDIDQKINKAYDDGYDQGYLQCKADSERATGHWIEITNNRGTVIALRCSCCKKSPKHAIKSDYCPNCGSPMEGVVYDV